MCQLVQIVNKQQLRTCLSNYKFLQKNIENKFYKNPQNWGFFMNKFGFLSMNFMNKNLQKTAKIRKIKTILKIFLCQRFSHFCLKSAFYSRWFL